MRNRAVALLVVAGVLWVSGGEQARAQACSRQDFEAAVGEAASALRQLNQANKPGFQSKLRQLKAKRGWDYATFIKEAAPIVQDSTIAGYDDRSADFLARIERLGAEGTSTDKPDCARLTEVRQNMRSLVEVQKAKWTYMFGKVEAELKK